jgi:hypothetical protein
VDCEGYKPLSSSILKRLILSLVLGSGLVFGLWVWQTYQELGPEGLLDRFSFRDKPTQIVFDPASDFRIKKQVKLFGTTVTRVVSSQQVEEFLILDKLPAVFLQQLNASTFSSAWLNTVANQLLKLRASTAGETLKTPPGITVLSVSAVSSKPLLFKQQMLSCRAFNITFQANRDTVVRNYEVGILQEAGLNRERVLVAYAPKGAFDLKLLTALLQALNKDAPE